MHSSVVDILPAKVRRSLVVLGGDIAVARRKRSLTVAMMVERISVSKNTYLRVERGDPTVSVAVYAMALFVLGYPDVFGKLIEPSRDEIGLSLDEERLPKRIRPKKGRAFS